MVVGPVGSGKSTLLAAMLGELETIKGAPVDLACRVAYAAQVPWILNATVKGNITFGPWADPGEAWYDTVIKKCCLQSDLDVLPGGDQTEIGERGVNLSGGQKARIALARAVYSKAKIYLFDDPLAAVDAHVGKSLFNDVCGPKGILADSTRVLVTHQVQYLPMADQVVVMNEGSITAVGTYQELLSQGAVLEELARQLSGASQKSGEGSEKGNGEPEKPPVVLPPGMGDPQKQQNAEEAGFGERPSMLADDDDAKKALAAQQSEKKSRKTQHRRNNLQRCSADVSLYCCLSPILGLSRDTRLALLPVDLCGYPSLHRLLACCLGGGR